MISRKRKKLALGLIAGLMLCHMAVVSAEPETEKSEDVSVMQEETSEGGEALAGADETVEADRQEAIHDIMMSNPEDAEDPNTEKPVLPEAAYSKQFTYSDAFSLSGIFETQSMFFYVPEYWNNDYAYAQVEFSLSQLIRDVPASMTFMVNNVPVYSCRVDYSYGKNQVVYLEIPCDLLKTGYNTFDITGYVRLFDEEGCIDDLSGANWVHIEKNTYVEVGYDLKPHEQKISCYPYPFISTVDETGSRTQIAVSDSKTNGELEAAFLLRADIASEASSEDNITLCTYGTRVSGKNTILISTRENLPKEAEGFLTGEDLQENLSEAALIRFAMDENGQPFLLIVSDSEECLMEAAKLLTDENRVFQEKTNRSLVKKGSAALVEENSAVSDLVAGRYTIEGLTGGGVSFIGPFHQTSEVFLPFSGGYVVSDSSKIVLNFRYSQNLDFRRSMITVYWGNVPVASKKLTAENADGDTLSFTMPQDVIGTYASAIAISFDLELPELYCTPRMDEMPWAYVTGDSALYLPMGVTSELSFDLRPYPFEMSSVFNDLCVVLPDEMSETELDTAGQIVSLYGEGITPYGKIRVMRASEFDEKDADYNLIVIGNYKDNPVIAGWNDKLSFSYEEEGARFASNSQMTLSDYYSRHVGVLQLLSSPYAENRGILVASGVDDDGMDILRSFIKVEKNTWKLHKDAVVIDEDMEIKAYKFLENSPAGNQLSLREFVEKNRDTVLYTVVSTSAMLLMLLIVILIFIRMRARDKKNGV